MKTDKKFKVIERRLGELRKPGNELDGGVIRRRKNLARVWVAAVMERSFVVVSSGKVVEL